MYLTIKRVSHNKYKIKNSDTNVIEFYNNQSPSKAVIAYKQKHKLQTIPEYHYIEFDNFFIPLKRKQY